MTKLIPHSKTTLTKKDFLDIEKTFTSGIITSNSKVKEFATKFKQYVQKEHIQLYSSGKQALYNLLFSFNLAKDDEILIPSYICSSIQTPILKIGAKLKYYDNEKDSWISSYSQIIKEVTPQTKIIIINHTFGIQYDYKEIAKLKKLGIILIEDCAHFISQEDKDIEISNLFMATFYSFNATKLITTGEGGAIATNNSDLAKELDKYNLDNGISDINATLGLSQLEQYNEFLLKRKEIANYYFENLGNITNQLQKYQSLYFRFPILSNNVTKFLESKKILYKRGVDNIFYKHINCSNLFNKTISIPIYPSLSKSKLTIIINETRKILNDY